MSTRTGMSPKERVRTALSHREPDRCPFAWGFGTTPEMGRVLDDELTRRGIGWARLRETVSDRAWIGPEYIGPPPEGGNTFIGIWGIKTVTTNYGTGEYAEFTDYPLAGVTDAADVHAYPWPDADAYDYEHMCDNLAAAEPGLEKARQYAAGNPFEIYCWMTGLEEALVNLVVNPAVVDAALGHIAGFMRERLRRVLQAGGDHIDMVFFADDLGSQNGLLMSREMYRRFLQPHHAALTAAVRELAPHAWSMLHSDGAVFEILPDVIDAGIQVHEAVRTDAAGMDPQRLKDAYGDRLSFHGGISVQQLLPRADADEVERQCAELVRIFGRGGGYIAAPSHAIQMGTPVDNVLAMLRGVLGREVYDAALEASRSGAQA